MPTVEMKEDMDKTERSTNMNEEKMDKKNIRRVI